MANIIEVMDQIDQMNQRQRNEARTAESYPVLKRHAELQNSGLEQALQEAALVTAMKKFRQPYEEAGYIPNAIGGAAMQDPQYKASVANLLNIPNVSRDESMLPTRGVPSGNGTMFGDGSTETDLTQGTSMGDIRGRTRNNMLAQKLNQGMLDIYGTNRPGGREREVAEGTERGRTAGSDWRAKDKSASDAAIALQRVANEGHIAAAKAGTDQRQEFDRKSLFGGIAGGAMQLGPLVQTSLSGAETLFATPGADKTKVHGTLSNLSTTAALIDMARKSAEAQMQALGADPVTTQRTLMAYDDMRNKLAAAYQRVFSVYGKMYDYSKPQGGASNAMSTFGNEGVAP